MVDVSTEHLDVEEASRCSVFEVLVIKEGNTYSPAGYSWSELGFIFGHLAVLQHENSGMRLEFQRIMNDIHLMNTCSETFSQQEAFVYLGAKASTGMTPLVPCINSIGEFDVCNRVFAAFSVLHLLYACTSNPYPRYTTIEPLAASLALHVEQNTGILRQYERLIIVYFVRNMRSNIYKKMPDVQRDIVRYLDKIREGSYDPEIKTQAVRACCFILSLL